MALSKRKQVFSESQIELPLGSIFNRIKYLYWNSRLFNEVYLEHDLPRLKSYWTNDEDDFKRFESQFQDLCFALKDQKFEHWNEADTQAKWIVKVMRLLGWHGDSLVDPFTDNISFSVNESGSKKSYRPDMVYVDDASDLPYLKGEKSSGDLLATQKYCKMVVEVKSWQRLDNYESKSQKKASDKEDSTKGYEPEEQLLKYMELLKQEFGILTDGNRWRLLHSGLSDGQNKRHFEFNLGAARNTALKLRDEDKNDVLWREYFENLKYFYYLFRKAAFYSTKHSLIHEILDYSRKYASRVEDDLTSSFIDAMTIICNSYRNCLGKTLDARELELVRSVAESHLFNILFIKSCEVRHVLPLRNTGYLKKSLTEIINTIEYPNFNPIAPDEYNAKRLVSLFSSFKYTNDGTHIYDRLLELYAIVQDGDFGLEIVGFKETVFDRTEWEFAKRHRLPNKDMARLLFTLGYTKAPPEEGRKYQQIPYSYFTPRQLGSIYESFLEFTLLEAEADQVYTEKTWKPANLGSEKVRNLDCPKVRRGDLFFSYDVKDRKKSGSFYTPDDIVQHITSKVLEPLVADKGPEEILALSVCDPSMGSGHFLNCALAFLTRAYREALADRVMDDIKETYSESARRVLHSCIYGSDLNPRAVKLAKMGLWLASANSFKKLERLDDQLIHGDSLVEDAKCSEFAINWRETFTQVFKKSEGFDAILGNPPYIFNRDSKFTENSKVYLEAKFGWSRYQINSAQMFVEQSYKILRKGGIVGFILPNNWLTIQTSDTFRKALIENSEALEITNCLIKVFEDASVDNAILIGVKGDGSQGAKLEKLILTENGFESLGGETIQPTKSVISIRSESESVSHLSKLISDTLEQSYPVKTGFVAYEVGKGKPVQTEEMKDNRVYHSESRKKGYRKYLDGKDVQRFKMGWSGQYVLYGPNLAAPRDSSLYEGFRVLIRQIPSNPPYCINACIVEGEEVNDRNSMIIKVPTEDEAYFVAGILNSKIISEWFVMTFDKFQRKTFRQIKSSEMGTFPFPRNVDEKLKKEIIAASRKITEVAAKRNVDSRSLEVLNRALEECLVKALIQAKSKKIKKAA